MVFKEEQDGIYLSLHAWESPLIAMERVMYFKSFRYYIPYIYQFELENSQEYSGVNFKESDISREHSRPLATENAGYLKEDSFTR